MIAADLSYGERTMTPRARILIVEDVEHNMDLLVQLLAEDYDLITAVDGAEGLIKAETERPDVILMDLSLPVLDGWETTRRIRENDALKDIPIIAVTGHAMQGEEEKARACGCDDFLTKPIDEDRLLERIERFIRRRSRQ